MRGTRGKGERMRSRRLQEGKWKEQRLKNGKAVGEDEIPGRYGNTEERD